MLLVCPERARPLAVDLTTAARVLEPSSSSELLSWDAPCNAGLAILNSNEAAFGRGNAIMELDVREGGIVHETVHLAPSEAVTDVCVLGDEHLVIAATRTSLHLCDRRCTGSRLDPAPPVASLNAGTTVASFAMAPHGDVFGIRTQDGWLSLVPMPVLEESLMCAAAGDRSAWARLSSDAVKCWHGDQQNRSLPNLSFSADGAWVATPIASTPDPPAPAGGRTDTHAVGIWPATTGRVTMPNAACPVLSVPPLTPLGAQDERPGPQRGRARVVEPIFGAEIARVHFAPHTRWLCLAAAAELGGGWVRTWGAPHAANECNCLGSTFRRAVMGGSATADGDPDDGDGSSISSSGDGDDGADDDAGDWDEEADGSTPTACTYDAADPALARLVDTSGGGGSGGIPSPGSAASASSHLSLGRMQPLFVCTTCPPANGTARRMALCWYCAGSCHRGHDVFSIGRRPFICECGTGPSSTPCTTRQAKSDAVISACNTASLSSAVHNFEGLFCTCRRPDDGSLMLQCFGCYDWFHCYCVGIVPFDKRPIVTDGHFLCAQCAESTRFAFLRSYPVVPLPRPPLPHTGARGETPPEAFELPPLRRCADEVSTSGSSPVLPSCCCGRGPLPCVGVCVSGGLGRKQHENDLSISRYYFAPRVEVTAMPVQHLRAPPP